MNDVQDIVKDLQRQGLGVLITDHNVGRRWRWWIKPISFARVRLFVGDQEFLVNDLRVSLFGSRFNM